MICVVICSPVPALRAGLSALLSGDGDIAVVEAAAHLPEPLPPETHVVVATPGALDLADLGLGEDSAQGDGLAPPAMAPPVMVPAPPLLLVSGNAPEEQREIRALPGLGLRAWGVISPDATAEALRAAVRALAEGLVVVSPDAQALLLAEDNPLEAPESIAEDGTVEHLTEREVEVLRLLAQGLTNKQIALALGISEHTVKFHVSSIYGKLGASNRTEAVRKGARKGWVPL